LTLAAIRKDDKADLSLRSVYNYGNYGLTAIFNTSDKVNVLATIDKVAPGVKVSLSATLPDTQSGKLLVDYVNQQVHVKSSVGLTTSPKVTVSAASGYKNLVFGAEAAYDTAKSEVSNYGFALGVHAGDSQLAVHLQDKAETLKLVAAHNVSKDKSVAAEITRPVAGGDVTFNLGHARRLDNGALLKTKIDHKGLLSALYEQRLSTGEKFVLSTQLDTLNIGGKAPKVGFALDLA
jgi:voltage-dependent anion channel protein 2